MEPDELSLFSTPEKDSADTPQQLSPSEEFRQAHPDFVDPVGEVDEWDPNARRASQLEGAGGGLKQGVEGTLGHTTEPAEKSDDSIDEESEREKAMRTSREMVERARQRAASEGRIIPTPEEAAANSRRAASNFLDARLPKKK